MEINFELTEEDYIQFNVHHAENSPLYKKTYQLLRYVLPILCAVIIRSVGSSTFRQPDIYWKIVAVAFVVIWIIVYPKRYNELLRRVVKKQLQEGDNSSLFGKKIMIIDEKEIKVIGEDSTEIILKASVKSVKVYEELIVIYQSGVTAQIVPTRCLSEESKRLLLKELGVMMVLK